MSENPASSDWAAGRGEKWRAQLFGMEPMLAPVDEPLIDALRLDQPCRIADIGCGGGGTTLEILRRAPVGSVVHGFDISPALIESALARSPSDEPAITFALADLETAPTPQEPYDRLVSRFGVMFYDHPPTAFAKLAGWLAPGGRFVFATWGSPAENPWMTSIREAVAEVIDVPPADPEAPGPFRYADGDKLLNLLRGAGFSDLEVLDWRGALPVGGGLPAQEAAHFALAASSIGALLAGAGDEALDAARQSLAERFHRHQQGGAVRMGACVHIFTGARPG
ncbi:MAG: methyltransferase domain-containing protein [Deltaproteobacteria bacterium]|nr:methyltransferase domain-containing protein [Deltaproteobacteria bacterium]